MLARVVDGRVVCFEGNPAHPRNRGKLCPKGVGQIMALYEAVLARWPVPYETFTLPTRHGETFVIGGLTQENSLNTKSKIPVLGDIPVAGELFKVRKGNRSRTELYIVITPHIVRHRRFELDPATTVDSAQNAAQQTTSQIN